jgi:protocatechuate 3,4-dioxygenase, alpha subunit
MRIDDPITAELVATPSQTVGPFFAICLPRMTIDNLAAPGVAGQKVTIRGHVLDADRKPVFDALIETWQANSYGKYAHPEDTQAKPVETGFKGFGRVSTDDDGAFSFTTIKPGAVPGPDGATQAPHIVVTFFSRGMLIHLYTRIYFPDEPANANDPVLKLVPEDRRSTLIAKRVPGSQDVFEWNVIMQGEGETVFFEC